MSTIGSGTSSLNPAVSTAPGAAGTATVTPGGAGAAAVALLDPRLAAQAQALAGVLAGTATIGFGASGPHVRALQDVLRAVGFAATPASGTLDRTTQQQLALFQRQQGLTPSGELDQATLARLDEVAAGAARAGAGGAGAAGAASGGRPVIGASAAAPVAAPAPADPLEGRLYMDATTFASMPPYQWARDSVELEAVMGVSGMEPAALLDALRRTNNRGRTTFDRMRRAEHADPFTLGYENSGVDDLRWDGDSHRARENMGFVSLTVESGRYEADPQTGEREVSVGTDKMDDAYYDTGNYDLLRNGLSVRGRARWDTDTEIRRILIGVKANSAVDEFGIKRCDKTDVRNDGASPEEIAGLDAAVRTGKTNWGREEAVKPLKGVYDALAAKGLLPDVGSHKGVLLMEPKVHVRSVRCRYHMNETELQDVRKLYAEAGAPKIQAALDLAARAKAAGVLSPQELATVEALEASGREALALAKMPDRGFGAAPASFEELERDRALSEEISAKYHAFAEQLDGARRIICDARSQDLEGHARLFVAWQKATDPNLTNKGAIDPFLAKYDAMSEAERQAFNDYGNAQRTAGNGDFRDFTPLDAGGLKALRPALENEVVRVHQRMIEEAGTAARGLWFDEAREFYVPGSYRNTSNFMIDTFDMSEYVKDEDWQAIPEAARTPASVIPKDKIFHTTLVSEVQIELGLEKPYLDRMAALKGEIDADRASLLMKWMTAGGRPGIDPANPASYGIALATLTQIPGAELEAEVAKLNDFLRAQGSALRPLTTEVVKRLDPNLLTAANRDKAVRTDGATERNLDGVRFVFEQYRDAQQRLAEAKGDRVRRMLRDAGAPRSIAWKPTEESKGDGALKILSGIQ